MKTGELNLKPNSFISFKLCLSLSLSASISTDISLLHLLPFAVCCHFVLAAAAAARQNKGALHKPSLEEIERSSTKKSPFEGPLFSKLLAALLYNNLDLTSQQISLRSVCLFKLLLLLELCL